MISGFWNGVTGLTAFEKAINVEANNSSNVNTVGFKKDETKFENLLYKDGFGYGAIVDTTTKTMTQGNLKLTNNSYDAAIEGKGYFMVSQRGESNVYYTRAGNFMMAEDGLLQTQDEMRVLGMAPQSNTVVTSDTTKTKFDSTYTKNIASQMINNSNLVQTINARATDYTTSAVNKGDSGNGYKSKTSQISDIEALISNYKTTLDTYSKNSSAIASSSIPQITTIDLTSALDKLNKENDTIKVSIDGDEITQLFDTDKETTMKKFSDQISAVAGLTSSVDTITGIVTINSLIPGKKVLINNAAINDRFVSTNNTQDSKMGTGIGIVNSSRDALKSALEFSGAKLLDITNTMSLVGQESLSVGELQVKLGNLGLTDTNFGKVQIDAGNIFVTDGENKFLVGKIQTATFTNEQGLVPQGNNLFEETSTSGKAFYAGNLNKIVGNSLELSTANMSNTLTNLLVFQKAYEANSKSITTSDEMLKTAIELKR